jgi:integrase
MRLLEAYRLRIEALDFDKRLIRVEGSKGWHGNIKPRTVPMKRRIHDELKAFCAGRTEGFVFPYWDGSEESRHNLTAKLSARFTSLFHYAGLPDLREHDLRHEATCRWLELRDPRGGWLFSDVEICRIMGWTNTRMMLRYASLRGEDLADRLKQI